MKKIRKNNSLFASLGALVFAAIGLVSCEEENDYTVDTANPTIVSYNPVAGVEGVAITSNLVLTFDENVKKGTGNIVIQSEANTQTIAVTSNEISIADDARIVIVNPEDFEANMEYTVSIDPGFVSDLLDNDFMGIPESETWTFLTAGESGPKVVELMPADDSTDAALFSLSAIFSTKISKGEGNIGIYTSTGDLVAEFSVLSQTVVVEDDVLSISMDTPFEFATAYYVTIDKGAIVDTEDNPFKGYTDDASWNFTTTAGSGSELVVYLPFDEDLSDASGNKFDAALGVTATADVSFVTDAERGSVIQFNAGSYASLPKHDLLRPSELQDFSCVMWFKIKGIGSDPALFGNKDWGSGGNPGIVLCTADGETYQPGTTDTGWIINLAGDPKASDNRMDWKAGKTDPQATALSDEKWHMVAMVLDQSNKKMHIYIDGVEYTQADNTKSYDLNTLTGPIWDRTNDYPFSIWEDGTGGYNAGSDTRKQLSGMVDDLRIYTKALSAAEITDLYNN